MERKQEDTRGDPDTRTRSWRQCRVCSRMGVAKRHRDRRIDQNRPRVRIRGGLENRPSTLSLPREIDPRPRRARCPFKRTFATRSCPPFLARSSRGIRPIPRSAISSLLSSARDRGRNRRGESTKATVKSSRVDGSRYIVEACAPAISRRGGVCRWKFYQYLGGHLVSLWQSFAKSYAPNADRGLTPSRPINRRRGLPE